jgi:hypothetical protein
LLEKARWSLMPQYQPARAVLFIPAFAMVLGGIAALRAGRWWERALWLTPALIIPLNPKLFQFFDSAARESFSAQQATLAAALALACALTMHWPRAALAALVLPYFLFPAVGHAPLVPEVKTEAVEDLARWARGNTPKDAMFLFPGAGRDPAPGVFRVTALRSVYVEWKGGGQVNLLRQFGLEWGARWRKLGKPPFDRARMDEYRAAGIDYVVVKRPDMEGAVYRNAEYGVLAAGEPRW